MNLKHSILAICFVSCQAFSADLKAELSQIPSHKIYNERKIPKTAKRYLEDLVYIETGILAPSGFVEPVKLLEKDSNFLYPYNSETNLSRWGIKLQSSFRQPEQTESRGSYNPGFYLSAHEVTNRQYREFVEWVIQSKARQILAKKFSEEYTSKGIDIFDVTVPINWNDSALSSLFYERSSLLYRDTGKRQIITNKLTYNYYDITNDSNIDLPIYPDTLCWINDFPYGFFTPMTNHYFRHPAYDNYPVVGVNWHQANAYCQWRTDQLNELLLIEAGIIPYRRFDPGEAPSIHIPNTFTMEDGILLPQFRLPTESEWEFAQQPADWVDSKSIWHYQESEIARITDHSGKYQANFGAIRDENGILLTQYHGDREGIAGSLEPRYMTQEVMTYAPNSKNIYDMVGNVSEWTSDMTFDFQNNEYGITSTDNYQSALSKFENYKIYEFDSLVNDQYRDAGYLAIYNDPVNEFILEQLNNLNLLSKNPTGKIIKGGSWIDGPLYLETASARLTPSNAGKSTIGFRVAQDCVPSIHYMGSNGPNVHGYNEIKKMHKKYLRKQGVHRINH